MGWARKNEFARIYRERRKDGEYVLVLENDYGNFNGKVTLLKRLDWTKWTVDRITNGEVHVLYDGVRQTVMGNWTTLCLPGKTCQPKDATDQEILQAYLGDESIYTGTPKYPQADPGAYCMVTGYCPDSWGGNMQRVALDECPKEFQRVVRGVLDGKLPGLTDAARGLHHMGKRTATCKFCGGVCDAKTAHVHQGGYVGDECCWDERLRATV